MRDRLKELILNAPKTDIVYGDIKLDKPIQTANTIADHLIANGVIVPPCKVGDTIWYELYGQIETAVIYSCIGSLTRNGFIITDAKAKSVDGVEVAFIGKSIGKAVFLSREDAERALYGESEIDMLANLNNRM